jgi:hypothetical protein
MSQVTLQSLVECIPLLIFVAFAAIAGACKL